MKRVWVGCSGWAYRDWRGVLYPEKLPQREWLARYAEEFGTVEINNTFYRLPKVEAVKGWVEQTPPSFRFAVKASRYLTHIKRLTDLDQGIQRYYERIEPLVGTPKLGPIVWQLPPNFKRDEDRLESALSALPEGRHCVEFRHPTWFTDNVYAILRAYGAALVIGDRKGLEFQTHEMTAGWTLVRFHHGHRGRRGNYSQS